MPASASRKEVTAPPKPEPTTTTSNASTELPHAALVARPPRTKQCAGGTGTRLTGRSRGIDTPPSLGGDTRTELCPLGSNPEMAVTALELLDAHRLEDVFDLCRRCLPDPPSKDELSASLYSSDQPVVVRGRPGLGIVATVCEGTQGYIRLLGVDPDVRGPGHGGDLLRAAGAGLPPRGARGLHGGAAPPDYLYPGVEPTQTAMLWLLERHRYERAETT